MNGFYGLLIAVSMYSKIPVPRVEWTGPRLRYVMCWFPMVGVICGLVLWLWFSLAWHLEIHPVKDENEQFTPDEVKELLLKELR